ncbi:Solute carrier family 35 member G1 [Orchesella cincta]|uniref:Solute carrier family 35 member G1 n=1 Tax=Orchesella cincta TaxID=48709 RepID=A0A1D2MX59_ORCCI|nr:Solute carrier family 35 member G1 [Orchesella cincta]
MESNSSTSTETSSAGNLQQPKSSVSHNTSPEISVTSESDCVPPPYSERSNSIPKSEPSYTVPKDMSEGLRNPVFVQNDDEDLSKPMSSLKPPSTAASFTSLNSHAPYTSQTTLYHKDGGGADAEKGTPTITTKDNEKKPEKAEYKGAKKYLGLLLTLSASFFFSIVVLFVKILKDYGFDAYGASFWRYTGTVIPTIPLLFFYECGPGVKKQSSVFTSVWPVFKNENWKTWIGLLSRGIIGSSSVILRYYALQYLTIGDTSVITYSTPVLVTVLAHFFLGERCGVFPIIIAFTTLCGVIIVTKPPILTGESGFDTNMLIGSAFAVGSLFCSALIVIITRKIREVHFTVMTLVFGIIGVVQAGLLIHFLGSYTTTLPTELFDSLLIAGVGGLSFLGQMSIVLALKFENAGPVALIRSCDVLFGFLFQYIFLDVAPDVFSAAGAVIVLLGVLSTGFRKWLNTLPEEDKRRKTWGFVLK